MNTYKMLFKYHPKEIAVPYREICRDKDEFYKKLNLYIGIYKSPIFASLYNRCHLYLYFQPHLA